jgi:polyisoprenoid-binding protein YceI
VDTNEADRDKHLKAEDFFFTEKYPNIQFKSTKVEYAGKIPKKIFGELTLRGVTKDIELSVDEWGGSAVDAWGNQRVAFEASGTIDRRNFGLVWNKATDKVKALTVGNDVKLELDVQGVEVVAEKKK